MKLHRKTLTIVLLAVLVSTLIPIPALAATITVETDETSYAPGDLVTISGVADANAIVGIQVDDPNDIAIYGDSVLADDQGAYESLISAPSTLGTYTVYVSITGASDSAIFDVVETGAPILAAIGDKTVNELVLLTFTATATDDPIDNLTFSLVDEPDGAVITAGGVFTWTPTEAQGPGEYTFTVRVTDEFPYSDEEEITVTVNEVNGPPAVSVLKLDKEWYHTGDTVSVTLNATYQNEDPTMKDIAAVSVSSDTEYSAKIMALTETGVNTSLFKGTFKLVGETAGTEELLVSDGDKFKVEYEYDPYSEEDEATVDNKKPTVTIIEPLKNSITTDNHTTISAHVEDDYIKSAWMTVDEIFRDARESTGIITYTPELLGPLSEGLHTVIVQAIDLAGNVNSTSWSFTIDTVKPTCTISTNATGPVKAGQIEITLEFNEGMKKLPAPKITTNATSYLTFSTTEKGWTALSNKTYGINATIAGAYNGTTLIDVTLAKDLAGNAMVAANFTFYIDTVLPTLPTNLDATVVGYTVVLGWTASVDNGSGMDRYDIYRGTTKVDSVDHPTVTFTDTTLTDSGTYSYTVKAYDEAGNSATSAADSVIYTAVPITSYNVSLLVGWNLFSLPLIPDDSSIEVVLADVMENIAQVWGYQEGVWLRYLPAVPQASTLTTMEDGIGYWIQMTLADNFTVSGVELPEPDELPPVYPVTEGWNMIGFKSVETMLIETYLTTIPDLVLDSSVCYGWDATLQEYELVYIARTPLDAVFEPGQGYWLYLPEDANIAPPVP